MTTTKKTNAKNNELHSAVIAAYDIATLHSIYFKQLRSIFSALDLIVPNPDIPSSLQKNDVAQMRTIADLVSTGSSLSEQFGEKCYGDLIELEQQLGNLEKTSE
jgi:hypothetical protein